MKVVLNPKFESCRIQEHRQDSLVKMSKNSDCLKLRTCIEKENWNCEANLRYFDRYVLRFFKVFGSPKKLPSEYHIPHSNWIALFITYISGGCCLKQGGA